MIWPQAFDFLIYFSVVFYKFLGRRMERRFISLSEKKRRSNRMHEERVIDSKTLAARANEVRRPPHNLDGKKARFARF